MTGLRAHSMCSWENENVHTNMDPTDRCNCWCDQREHIGAQLKTETYRQAMPPMRPGIACILVSTRSTK